MARESMGKRVMAEPVKQSVGPSALATDKSPPYDHARWGWGPVRGAYGITGGHVKFFGSCYSWIFGPPYSKLELSFFGLFAVERIIFRGETEWRWAFGKLQIIWRRAESRFYEATKERERRKWRRKIARESAHVER